MRREHLIITGATGFIGSALAMHFAARGYHVHCPVRQRGGSPQLAACENLTLYHLPKHTPETIVAAFGHLSGDVCAVLHLAAAGIQPVSRTSSLLFEGNVGLLHAWLEASRQLRPRQFIHTGSWSEYAPPRNDARVAETHPLSTASLYAASKAAGLMWAQALADAIELPFVCLRLFQVYGPDEAPHRLFPTLFHGLMRNQTIALTSGLQVRDFVYIDDVVDAYSVVLEASHNQPESAIYNVCSGHGVRVKEMVRGVADALGKPASLLDFEALPSRTHEPGRFVGDPTALLQHHGWRSTISNHDGIIRLVNAWKERIDG